MWLGLKPKLRMGQRDAVGTKIHRLVDHEGPIETAAALDHLPSADRLAGFEQAHEWRSSQDPMLVQDAVTVLTNIGGYKSDLRAAEAAPKAAQDRESNSLR